MVKWLRKNGLGSLEGKVLIEVHGHKTKKYRWNSKSTKILSKRQVLAQQRHHIPEDRTLYNHRRDKLEPQEINVSMCGKIPSYERTFFIHRVYMLEPMAMSFSSQAVVTVVTLQLQLALLPRLNYLVDHNTTFNRQ